MAYQALYRKYRPQNFDEVVGQRQIVKTLNNAIKRNRIAHAYLFSGPRGTGKTSIAKIFARTLNCTSDHPPCGECDNCKEALAGSHPDIIEIDAASNNGVDEVRRIIERISYSPMEGRYKVYIIDEVHMMTQGAFNALLKTIEEPPEDVVFIFATTEPNKVLPTILSRCQRFDFSKVSDQDIVFRLRQVCEAEGIQIDDESLELVASLADGGMRDALSILDQCAAYAGEEPITPGLIREIYGVVTSSDISEIFQDLSPEKANEAIEKLTRISNQGMDLKRFTADLISLLKDSLLLDYSPKTDLISESRKELLQSRFLPVPSFKRRRLLEDLMDIYSKYSYASSVLDYLETTLLKSVWIEEEVPVRPSSVEISAHAKMGSSDHSGRNNSRGSAGQISGSASSSDSQQKKLNTGQNGPQIAGKTNFSEQFFKSSVSRGTSANSYDHDLNSLLDDEKMLGIIRTGNKETKAAYASQIQRSSEYLNDLKYAKFSGALQGAKVEVAGENFMIVSTSSAVERDSINDLEDSDGFEQFTNVLFGKPVRVFALTAQKTRELLHQFVMRMKNNTLPSPVQVRLKQREEKTASEPAKELSDEEVIQSYFPDVKIIDD